MSTSPANLSKSQLESHSKSQIDNQNQIQALNEELIFSTFQAPQLHDIPHAQAKIQYQPSTGKNTTRAAVMKREYDQKLEQTRQITQRNIADQERHELERFKDTKIKLIQGNETIIRDVDQILLVQTQEKLLAREKTFVDYEMNTFLPMHRQIMDHIERGAEERNAKRTQLHQDFANYTRQKHVTLDNVNAQEYDPFSISTQKLRVKINDPVERAAHSTRLENETIKDIERLTGVKQPEFVGHKTELGRLRRGSVDPDEEMRQRDILDVKKWNNIENAIVVPGGNRGKKMVQEFKKTQPFALHE